MCLGSSCIRILRREPALFAPRSALSDEPWPSLDQQLFATIQYSFESSTTASWLWARNRSMAWLRLPVNWRRYPSSAGKSASQTRQHCCCSAETIEKPSRYFSPKIWHSVLGSKAKRHWSAAWKAGHVLFTVSTSFSDSARLWFPCLPLPASAMPATGNPWCCWLISYYISTIGAKKFSFGQQWPLVNY